MKCWCGCSSRHVHLIPFGGGLFRIGVCCIYNMSIKIIVPSIYNGSSDFLTYAVMFAL